MVGIVLTHRGGLLFEVDVDGDWFDVVERIFLVEWNAKVTFVFHLGSRDVLLDKLRVMLARSNGDGGI